MPQLPHDLLQPACQHVTPEAVQEFTGSVGAPLPLLTFRLEAVPEMGYNPLADPPRGEIIIKGPVVFQGYFKVRACRACEELFCAMQFTSLWLAASLKDEVGVETALTFSSGP